MFKITIAECETFKKQIKVISDLISEGKIKVNKDSFGLIAMDASNVAMVDYEVFSSACTEYMVDKEDEFAINFSNFYQALKTASANAIINLTKEKNKLILEIKAETDRTFKLPITDYSEKDAKKAELKHNVKIKVDSGIFKQEIKAFSLVAESVLFVTKDDKFMVKAEGDISEVKTDFKDIEVISEKKSEIKSKYPIEYLKKVMEASAFCNEMEINYAKDYPAQFIFKQVDKFKMDFTLAPRVDSD